MIRFFDCLFSILGIVLLFPIFIIISFSIRACSSGGIFFTQTRVGLNGGLFKLIKFRTMVDSAEKLGQLTIGTNDYRITGVGTFLRRHKLDELPQLFNVLKGDMSLVGPRPEVQKYTDYYTEEQRKILTIRPGVTDYASIVYFDENELLAQSANPEETYIREILPQKIELNMVFVNNPNLKNYFKVITSTIKRIFI